MNSESSTASRRLSLSEYAAVPQAPVAATVPLLSRSISDAADLNEDATLQDCENATTIEAQTAHLVDGRIRAVHFILGCAVLLPWNVMITATPYFLSRVAGSSLESTFNSYLSTTYTATGFAVLAYAVYTNKEADSSKRTLHSTLVLAFLTFLLTLSTYVRPSPGLFFAFVITNGIVQSAAGSFMQTSVVGLSALFGPSAMQNVMSGQAAIGVLVSGVQVLSALGSIHTSADGLSDGVEEERAAFAFFGFSTLFLLVSIGAHAWLLTTPAYKTLVLPYQGVSSKAVAGSPDSPGLDDEEPDGVSLVSSVESPRERIFRVAKANLIFEVAVSYVFITTLSVFPPITAAVMPTNPSTHPLLFVALHFLVFSLGDFIGRYMCCIPALIIWDAPRLLLLSLARTLFIPLFLMCNIQRGSISSPVSSSPIISSDLLFMLVVLLFGTSNGYTTSLCMMAASSVKHNPRLRGRVEDVDVAATLGTFSIVGGLAVGSMASFVVRGVMCGCNPFVT